jgi:hypothetical protein
MTVNELEAEAHSAEANVAMLYVNPLLILQLIEERRLLARYIELFDEMTSDERTRAIGASYRVITEIEQCKS